MAIAAGHARGVVRNIYYQSTMGEVMPLSVEVLEEQREMLRYRPVGSVAISDPVLMPT